MFAEAFRGRSVWLSGHTGFKGRLRHEIGDVRDAAVVRRSLPAAAPDFVFHLAAQPLVRTSYEDPVGIHAADLATWLWTILLRGKTGRPYNVGSKGSCALAEVARAVAHIVDNRGVVIARPPRRQPLERYVPCTARAPQELRLADGVARGVAIAQTLHRLLPSRGRKI